MSKSLNLKNFLKDEIKVQKHDSVVVHSKLNENLSNICQEVEVKVRKHGLDLPGVKDEIKVQEHVSIIVHPKPNKNLSNIPSRRQEVEVKVQKHGLDLPGVVHLEFNELLPNIRQVLENDTYISMNDTLLFTKKGSVIAREKEELYRLNGIIEESDDGKLIRLVKNTSLDYDLKILKKNLQLEHGRKINPGGEIVIAEEKAFILDVKEFKVTEYKGKGCKKDTKEISSSEYNKSITGLVLNSDINDFVKTGSSYENSKNTMSGSGMKSICHLNCFDKISLKFKSGEKIYFEPTKEFINEIKKAIDIKDHTKKLQKFKHITEKFGQFISNEVLLGGRIYRVAVEKSGEFFKEKTHKISTNTNVLSSNIGITHTSGKSMGNANYSKNDYFKLIGGKQPDGFDNFDEKNWSESLNDFENWDCTEYKNPVSIFQLLPYERRKEIFKSIGKRILYNNPGEEYIYKPNEERDFELKNIPSRIAEIIQEEDAECNIFATVIDIDDSKNEFFNCQILWVPKMKPKLIIHCIQKNPKKIEYKLKVGLMIVGYDIKFDFINSDFDVQFKVIEKQIKASSLMEYNKLSDDSYTEKSICLGIPVLRELKPYIVIGHHFHNYRERNRIEIGTCTFSYCLKKNQHVKLPEFTFYTLIISNYPDSYKYGISSFNCKNSYFKYFKNNKPNSPKPVIPKYISLHSKKDNCAPIFLKQKQNEIKIKYIKGEDCKDTCICDKTLKDDDLKLHLIAPEVFVFLFLNFNVLNSCIYFFFFFFLLGST
jgi:hypothetical protein